MEICQHQAHPVFVVQELQRGRSHQTLVIDPISLTLAQLKDRAQGNLYMGKASLFCRLDNFTSGSPQHYAIAVQLRRQHHDKSEETAIAEHDAVCSDCKRPVVVDPRYLFRFGRARCNSCGKNVGFTLVAPLPREPSEPPPSVEEIQARLKRRFGE